MKKGIKRSAESLIYKGQLFSLVRINGVMHLVSIGDEVTADVFDILAWGISSNETDDNFWSAKINSGDRLSAKPVNIIYALTGGDAIWKKNNWVWKSEWQEMHEVFLEHFESKLTNMLKKSTTLGQLRDKVIKNVTSEDFYELGLRLGLVNEEI